jgi:hypothetical protein
MQRAAVDVAYGAPISASFLHDLSNFAAHAFLSSAIPFSRSTLIPMPSIRSAPSIPHALMSPLSQAV